MMRAIIAREPGPPDVLTLVERPVPHPAAQEVLIKVAAAGVNRPDVLQRIGQYPMPPGASDVLGLEIAGEVVKLGEGVARWRVGDKVCALVPGGGYAEYAVSHEATVLPWPQGLSAEEAAAIPETFFTVWDNVFERGRLKPGEWLLVHGGASGIGTTAIQLAKAFGAKVITTVGDEDKARACRDLGADVAVNYKTEDFVAATKAATGRGADVILDMVGGDYVPRNYAAAGMDARIVQIAFLRGPQVSLDLLPLMMKRLVHTGSTLRPRSPAEKGVIAQALEAQVWPLIAAGKLRPMMDQTFALADAAKAHARMEASLHIGKIVLKV